MELISTGYFKEMSDAQPNSPSIKDYINKPINYDMDKICHYLDSGLPLVITPGVVADVIDEDKGIAGSPSILTDGKWAWSGVLSYYVRNYNLLLNDEFIDTMINNEWKIPLNEKDLDYSNILIDGNSIQ